METWALRETVTPSESKFQVLFNRSTEGKNRLMTSIIWYLKTDLNQCAHFLDEISSTMILRYSISDAVTSQLSALEISELSGRETALAELARFSLRANFIKYAYELCYKPCTWKDRSNGTQTSPSYC
jgi:hypothetical protein